MKSFTTMFLECVSGDTLPCCQVTADWSVTLSTGFPSRCQLWLVFDASYTANTNGSVEASFDYTNFSRLFHDKKLKFSSTMPGAALRRGPDGLRLHVAQAATAQQRRWLLPRLAQAALRAAGRGVGGVCPWDAPSFRAPSRGGCMVRDTKDG